MTHTPTPEQAAILSAVCETADNLIIDALAGAAKTSTLVMACEAHRVPTLSIAFNKKTALELADRVPPHVEAKTLHSLGYKAVSRFINKSRLTLSDSKTFNLLKETINTFSGGEASTLRENFSDLLWAINFSGDCGWVPDKTYPHAKPLMSDMEFFAHLEDNERGWQASSAEIRVMRKVVQESIHLALKGTISFTDMVFIPAVFPCQFQHYSLTMGDEVQDWSPLNHVLIKKILGPKGRFIAAGDPRQSIYGFRGAAQDSMSRLRRQFDMATLPLTTSFRCPRSVVEHVSWRAPSMRAPSWAENGSVNILNQWDASTIPPSAAIICRNNAPLYRCALRLLRAGRRPQIIGNDILKGLVKDLEKLGDPRTPQTQALELCSEFAEKLRRRFTGRLYIEDKIAAIHHFIEIGENLGHSVLLAKQLMTSTGGIQLMSGHKSKGLEFDDVFILDPQLIQDGEQEDNLRYVMATRSKRNLTYITSDGWY